ncbi:hypothetical protein AVEN_211494-1 [Araneus ventricosus]|uniref:Uncharacterized protein n=1 Tax=Araneus ventricosus TaxID=182803 RepID=A0A4Y2V6I5_ARAVE|nr:hypothetical protein AVEN_211494-1 [Araneus ventricosus]
MQSTDGNNFGQVKFAPMNRVVAMRGISISVKVHEKLVIINPQINPLNGSNISAECFENGPSVARRCTQFAPRLSHGRREKRQSEFSFPLGLLFRITAGYHLLHCPVA